MAILYFLFLFSSTVSGFLVQNGSTGISSSQTSADRTIQNLLNLIVNEQNSRLQLQNIVTTLSNKIDQLENAQDQMQKNSDVKLNQTENEMVKKMNEMSARLVQMEQFNTEVSKQLDKEKNNRENLEEMYTVLEKRVNNLTMECGASTTQSEKRNIEMTLNNLTSLFAANRNNLIDVNTKLVNLTYLYKDDFKVMEVKLQNLTNSSSFLHDRLVATETKLSDITSLFTTTLNNLTAVNTKLVNLTYLYKDDFKVMEVKLKNLTNSSSFMHDRLVAIETKLGNITSLFTANHNNLTEVNSKLINMTYIFKDDFKVMEMKLGNLTVGENEIHIRLNSISNETAALKLLFSNLTKQTETRSNVTHYEMVTLQATVTQNQHELAVINSTLSDLIKNVTISDLTKYHEAVGFSVNNPNKSSGSPLKYQTLTYNTGHGYNMSTGVFTCKYPGLYFFTATMFRSPGVYESVCFFYVNNIEYNRLNSGAGSEAGYNSATESIVFMLDVGDRVYISRCSNVDHMYRYTSFSGFLISN